MPCLNIICISSCITLSFMAAMSPTTFGKGNLAAAMQNAERHCRRTGRLGAYG